jgi:H+-translocating NAD(P) transhydrogenase subunit beta
MPILDADKARAAIIIKRSLNPGFAGINNEVFYHDKTLMFRPRTKGADDTLQ